MTKPQVINKHGGLVLMFGVLLKQNQN